MRERKRKHDDTHFPLQGRGKRAPKGSLHRSLEGKIKLKRCPACGIYPDGYAHLCDERLTKAASDDRPKDG